MFILCEKLEDEIYVPILNKNGKVIEFKNREYADEERIYLQPDYDNLIAIRISE